MRTAPGMMLNSLNKEDAYFNNSAGLFFFSIHSLYNFLKFTRNNNPFSVSNVNQSQSQMLLLTLLEGRIFPNSHLYPCSAPVSRRWPLNCVILFCAVRGSCIRITIHFSLLWKCRCTKRNFCLRIWPLRVSLVVKEEWVRFVQSEFTGYLWLKVETS